MSIVVWNILYFNYIYSYVYEFYYYVFKILYISFDGKLNEFRINNFYVVCGGNMNWNDLVNRFIILKCRFILGRENFMFKISIKEIWNVIKNNV